MRPSPAAGATRGAGTRSHHAQSAGADIGTPYRSGIYWTEDSQQEVIARVLADANNELGGRVVTEVDPPANYSLAEACHQHYYANNPRQGYCAAAIGPRLEKFRKSFRNRLAG